MVSIGPKIFIQGEDSFRLALKRIYSEVKALDKEMDVLTSSFTKYDSALKKNSETHKMLDRQLQEHNRSLKETENMRDRARAALEKSQQKEREAIATYQKLVAEKGKDNEETKEAEEAARKATDAVNLQAKVLADWEGKVSDARIEVNNLKNALLELPSSLEVVGDGFIKAGDYIAKAGDKLTASVTTPLVALGTASVKNATSFEDGMAKIYTIAKEGQKPMQEMKDELEALSNQTAFSVEDLTEATYQAVSASVKTEDAVGFVSDAVRLARAGFTDTTMAVDLLTTTINAYGYEAKDAAKISDILLKTQNDGKTIVQELAGSMGTVIPTAAAYNVSLENLSAAYVVMTKKGINTARSTTFLNSMFTELERESSDVSKTLQEKTGKSFAQLMDDGKSLGDVLQILYKAVGEDDEAFARLWKNVRAGRGGLALVQGGTEAFNTALERINESAGQTDYALDVLETTSLKAKRAINQLKNTSAELGSELLKALYPTFEKIIKGISDFTDWFKSLDDSTKQAIVRTLLLAASLGPVLSIGGRIIKGGGKVLKFMGKAHKWIKYMGSALDIALPTAESLFAALGKAIDLLPGIGAIASAYLVLGVSAKNMQNARQKQIEQEYGLSDAMKTSIATIDEIKRAHDEWLETQYASREATETNALYVQELSDKYNELVQKNGKVKESDQELANYIIDELATSLGINRDEVQKLIEKNGKFGESLDKVIEKMKTEAMMAAYKDYLTEAVKRQIAAQREYNNIHDQLRPIEEKLLEAQNNYDAALQEYNAHLADGTAETGGYKDKLEDAIYALANAKDAHNQMTDALTDARTEIGEATQDVAFYSKQISATAGKTMDEVNQAIEDGIEEGKENADEYRETVEDALKLDTDPIAYEAMYGMSSAIERYGADVVRAAKRVAANAARGMRNELQIESPSKVTMAIGKYTMEGFTEGMEIAGKQSVDTARMLAEAASQSYAFRNSYEPNGRNYTKSISAPITVSVNVNGNVDNYDALAESIAQRINEAIAIKEEVFA